jgi:hypothetical protein
MFPDEGTIFSGKVGKVDECMFIWTAFVAGQQTSHAP